MQVSINVVRLPTVIINEFLEKLMLTVGPILAEEIPPKNQRDLIRNAYSACSKAICWKFSKEIEDAGLFEGVVCYDIPDFTWNSGMKFCYAMDMFNGCVLKTLAEEVGIVERDLGPFQEFLAEWFKISAAAAADEMLNDTSDSHKYRLHPHVIGLAQANARMMVGETPIVMSKILTDAHKALEEGRNPSEAFAANYGWLVPSATTFL